MSDLKERPILFSGVMVQAILAGRKSQTRRVITPQPDESTANFSSELVTEAWLAGEIPVKCPYGPPGDRLWVRESWGYRGNHWSNQKTEVEDIFIEYRADGEKRTVTKPNGTSDSLNRQREGDLNFNYEAYWASWRPSIFMPRWASRLTLEVKKVRVERLQEISDRDARAEGVTLNCSGDHLSHDVACHIEHYEDLWDSINEKRGFGWAKNPWVWVVEFQRVQSARIGA